MTQARTSAVRWGAIAAVTALSAVGCGRTSPTSSSSASTTNAAAQTVDSAQVEQGIKDSLSTPSVKVTDAKCPTDVKAEKGAKFTCSVTLSNGGTGKAEVTQTGPNSFTYVLTEGSVQIPGETADAAVEKSLAAKGAPGATVHCPETVIVKVGTTVTCNVSGVQGVASGTVTYTFSEANGTVDSSSVKTG
jgi:hypothetical protein